MSSPIYLLSIWEREYAMKISDKKLKTLIKALDRAGYPIRNSAAHIIVKCPSGSVTMSSKGYHYDKQLKDLERMGVDTSSLAL